MLKRLGETFMLAGIIFLIYGVALLLLVSPPVKIGFLLNIIFYVLDSIWFICSGIFLLYSGLTIHKKKDISLTQISFAGHFFIFSIVALITAYFFNILAILHFQSTGRIFTFLFQALSRLSSPSLSYEFIVPLIGISAFAACSIWFQYAGMKMINKKL